MLDDSQLVLDKFQIQTSWLEQKADEEDWLIPETSGGVLFCYTDALECYRLIPRWINSRPNIWGKSRGTYLTS